MLPTCFHAGCLLGFFFDPGDRSDMFLLNVGALSTYYIFQKIEFFIITAVRTTKPITLSFLQIYSACT
jgi:hypothetical protein